MEESMKTRNDQEKKKMVIKLGGGGGGGGGIGAVVLLGGVLATAALASAFVVGRKGRSSAKDRRRSHESPTREINKKIEVDEATKGQEIIFPDQPRDDHHKYQSEGTKEEDEFSVSTQSVTVDEKARVEMNFEVTEKILSSISPKKLEKDAVSDDGFVVVEEDFSKDQLTKEDVSNDHPKESENLDREVFIEEESGEGEHNGHGEIEVKSYKEVDNAVDGVRAERIEAETKGNIEVLVEKKELGGLSCGNGEIDGEKCVEAVERAEVDSNEDGIRNDKKDIGNDSSLSGNIVSESHNQDGKRTLLPVDNPVVENDIAIGEEREGEIVEVIEENQDDRAEYIEEKLVEGQEKCDQPDEEIVPTKSEEVECIDEAKQSEQLSELIEERDEDNGCIVHPALENTVPMLENLNIDAEFTKEDGANEEVTRGNEKTVQFDAEKNTEKEVEEELISPEDVETKNNDDSSEEIHDSQPNDDKDDLERDIEKEVEEGMISHEIIEATKDEIANAEEVDIAEESENKSSVQFVIGQPNEHDKNSFEMNNTNISTAKQDDLITEMSDDEGKSAESDETASSDEVEESSVGTGDSSTESNCEAIWPAESPEESSTEPQKAKLVNDEVGGKIQEDKAVKEEEDNSFIIGEKSSFEPHKVKDVNKYVVELGTLKDRPIKSTRRRVVVATLSVLSSLSCSWFFGLSFVKLCLVIFLTMALSELHGF